MRFKDIKINKDGVELDRVEKLHDGSQLTQKLSNAARPLPSFMAALQAFSGYAVGLVGVPEWHDDANVTSVHLSEEPKTSRRGLIVTFTRRIERAKNRTAVYNTPLMHAPVDDQEGTNPGTFPEEVATMIVEVEKEATRYWNGEREQQEMFSREESSKGGDAPAGADQADELAKRRGKGSKAPRNAGTPGEVMNPGQTEPPTDEKIRQLLLAAGRDVPIDAIARVTATERDQAQRWAEQAVDPKVKEAKRMKEPEWVVRDATPALLDDVAGAQGATK